MHKNNSETNIFLSLLRLPPTAIRQDKIHFSFNYLVLSREKVVAIARKKNHERMCQGQILPTSRSPQVIK